MQEAHVAADDEVAPACAYLPAAHAKPLHELAAVAPVYLPASQEAHVDAPVALEYLPATHRVHVAADDEDDPGVPYMPAAHAEPEHVADELAPVALEYVPATQSVHSEAPAVQAQRQTKPMSKTGHAAHTHTQKHTITLASTTHALARHPGSMTLGKRVCVCQGVSVCVLWPPSPLSASCVQW